MRSGKRKTENGKRRAESGKRKAESGERKTETLTITNFFILYPSNLVRRRLACETFNFNL